MQPRLQLLTVVARLLILRVLFLSEGSKHGCGQIFIGTVGEYYNNIASFHFACGAYGGKECRSAAHAREDSFG